jgi:two-component system sensor histidine kinase/response regulator
MRNTKTLEKTKTDESPNGELMETYAVADQEQFLELLPALLNSSQSVFYIVQDKKFQVVTKQLIRQIGLSQKELLGKESLSIVHPDDRTRVRENAVQMLKGERSEPYEFRFLDTDGNLHYIREAVTSILYKGKSATLGNWIELTEQKQAEEELRQNERKYRTLVENLPQKIFLKDKNLVYVSCNENFARDFKIKPEEIVGKTDYDFFSKKIAEKHRADDCRIIELKKLENIEEGHSINGQEVFVHTVKTPIIGESGDAAGVLSVSWDISEQKVREKQLIESEAKYRSIFESVNDVIILLDRRGRILDVNSKVIDMAGYEREDLIGHDFRTLSKIITKKSLAVLAYNFAKRIAGASVPAYEVEMRNKDGKIINVEINAVPLKIRGKIAGDLAILRDVTQQKRNLQAIEESEEKFSKAFQSNPNPCFITNLRNGMFVEINDSFSRITGFTKKDAIGNTTGKICLWAGENDDERIRSILRKHNQVTSEEILFRTKKGEFRHGVYSAEVIKLSGEDCVLTTINDVTERKNMDEELRKHRDHLEDLVQQRTKELGSVNKQLEKELTERKRIEEELITAISDADAASRAKGDFLARMSHEIRTPIHGVMGTLDLLGDTELGQEQRQYVNMARTSAESLLNVINDVLDFSKIEAGKIELDIKEFNLRTLLEQTLETIAVPAHKKGLEILMQISPDIPEELVGDDGRLRQILINLLGNAIKFTEQGDVVLRVNVEADREKEQELHFSIRDSGIGIPEEKQKQLFHPFEQVDGSMNRKHGGSGLGLAICQQLVNIMGGRIWFTSWPGEGSIFHFTAKFVKQVDNQDVKKLTEIPPGLRGIPILLIDDNTTFRSTLRDTLTAWGFQVTDVDNVHSALQELEDSKGTSRYFRMIMLDKTMPAMSGFAVAEKMLHDTSLHSSIVMMLTSDSISDDFSRCQELGISHYLVKPIKESELLKTIFTALGYAKTDVETSQQAVSVPSNKDMPHLNILVAEDNATSQVIAKKILEKAGHTVQIAGNGVEAIKMVKEGSHDLVLMDVEMPEMNGLEATQFIRNTEQKSEQHIPIIAMTAYAMKEDRQRCLQAGMDAYLSKPVNLEELYSTIGGFSIDKKPESDVTDIEASEIMDIKAAMKVVGGDEDILKEVVTVFLEHDYPKQLRRLTEAMEQNDAQAVREAAHSIKGASRSFGASALGSTALKLEEMGRSSDLTGIELILKQLEREGEEFAAFFNEYSHQKV